MSANLGRCHRLDKLYSRARDRMETLRTVDEELHDDFEMPIVPREEQDGETPLSSLMRVNATDSSREARG